MARILWLPGVLRAAGLDVVEEPGWKARGRDDFEPFGLIAHATAGGLQQSNASALGVIINGRPGLSGPIGQAMIERGTGRWRIVASGASNHAKTGWGGLLKNHGNRTLIGVECHHNNLDEPWTRTVYDSYVTGFAAICRAMGWDPATRIAAHKEHQPGEKSDPTFDPGAFRAHVKRAMVGAPTATEGPDMQVITIARSATGQLYKCTGTESWPITEADLADINHLSREGRWALCWDAKGVGHPRGGWYPAAFGEVQETQAERAMRAQREVDTLAAAQQTLAAIRAAGGDPSALDQAAIIAHINRRADEVRVLLEEADAENAALRGRLADALLRAQ